MSYIYNQERNGIERLSEVTAEEEAQIRKAARKYAAMDFNDREFSHQKACPSLEGRMRPMEWVNIERFYFRDEVVNMSVLDIEPLTVRELISACCLTAKQFSQILGIPQRTVYNWCGGAPIQPWQLDLLVFRMENDPRYGKRVRAYREKQEQEVNDAIIGADFDFSEGGTSAVVPGDA